MAVDSNNRDEFLGRFVNDLGAAVHARMIVIGERLATKATTRNRTWNASRHA